MFASEAWRMISAHALADEASLMDQLRDTLDHRPATLQTIAEQAARWIAPVREEPPPRGVSGLMRQFPLGSAEATALMRLAEALPRITDAGVADALIRELLGSIDWLDPQRSQPPSAARRLLGLARRWLRHSETVPTERLRRFAGNVSDPLIRRGIRSGIAQLAGSYVLGQDLQAALRIARRERERGETYSFDLLGEGAITADDSRRYRSAYEDALKRLGELDLHDTALRPSLSVKLSALHPRYEASQWHRLQEELLPWLVEFVTNAAALDITVTIDAEEADRLELGLMLLERAYSSLPPAARPSLGVVLQAYGKRAWYVLPWLLALGERFQVKIPLRLVKGAYWDTEIKRAQQSGLRDYPVFTSKQATDIAYLACANWLLSHSRYFYPQFGTHNAVTVAAVLQAAQAAEIGFEHFEFQRLHGMGESLYGVVRQQYPALRLRIYAPVGPIRELLPYLVRRLLENSANSSFVMQLHDTACTTDELARHPLQCPPAPPTVPSPAMLYLPERINSPGVWLATERDRIAFLHELNAFRGDRRDSDETGAVAVRSPFDDSPVGSWEPTSPATIPAMVARANAGFRNWSVVDTSERRTILERVAETLEIHRADLVAMMCRETGKTLVDALEEVREAADLCRYYAYHAMQLMERDRSLAGPTGENNRLRYRPRGTFLCIAPWNFPVAIFSGQIAAALATGNSVIAKPAEQATLTAALVARLFHEAGVPPDALQLALGAGESAGAALCRQEHIAGVAFTGSWETARTINRLLAAREGALVPLIAETGGINALVADASAYPPQLVRDVIRSAFNSAGQRCSALRLLFLPASIAAEVETLLCGALNELVLGDPLDWGTDIGPLIDQQSHARLSDYVDAWRRRGRLLATVAKPKHGLFLPPAIIALDRPEELTTERFGPILHVVRYRVIEEAIEWINASGFGLTAGIHSRNEAHALRLAEQLHVGNCYINRDIIGAVVGSQPFGGEARSGTGFKAGGPNYLLRFLHERSVTLNTAAWGADHQLMGASPSSGPRHR